MKSRLFITSPSIEQADGKEWQWESADRRLVNHRIGVSHCIVDMVDHVGRKIYEGHIVVAPRLELFIILRKEDLSLGFVRRRHDRVLLPTAVEDFWDKNPGKAPDPTILPSGIEQLECVHGIALNPFEEVEEESGYLVEESQRIGTGYVHDGPTLMGIPHLLYAVLVKNPSGKHPAPGEQILGFEWLTPHETIQMETTCTKTAAALWQFRRWGLTQEHGSHWYKVAREL